jgi:two-component system sensor histidine kinase KdpD
MPESERRRPTPEQLLKQAEAEERRLKRGKLKVFLGYASGVGKSFRMFDEGRRRKQRGQDVVVAAVQPPLSPEVERSLRGLEVIPLRDIRGTPMLDVPTILKRRPGVCLIDGLAYDNPPEAKNPHRWQDVEELLAAGIPVVTSVNLQYVKERQPQVEAIRGKVAKESVPEAFLRTAEEIEIVDAPPEYCVSRSNRGDGSVAPEVIERQLSELREIALLLAAEVVDQQLEAYLHRQGIEQHYGTHERILVCVTPRSNAALMIHRGKRQADRFHGALYVVHVEQDELTDADQRMLDQNLTTAREAGAHVETLHGDDAVAAILRFAATQGITQIFVGHSQRSGWLDKLRPNPVERMIVESEGVDVRIFPHVDSPA